MEYINFNLKEFFNQELERLKCNDMTKAYIVSVFDKYKATNDDFSKESLTILYAKARYAQDFNTYQNIGDWMFFTRTMFPEHLNNASENYYTALAQMSYYQCYKIIKWQLYEFLADDFIKLTNHSRKIILQ